MKAIERWRLLKERIGTPALFLLSALLVAGIVALIDSAIIDSALPLFLGILEQTWHILLIVFALLFLFNLLLTPKQVKSWLRHANGWKGWPLAVLGGILSSGPIYLWYPLLAELEKHGMRQGLTATFLYNRAVKPALLPLLIAYFGLAYTIILTAYMVLFSVVQGMVIERMIGTKDLGVKG